MLKKFIHITLLCLITALLVNQPAKGCCALKIKEESKCCSAKEKESKCCNELIQNLADPSSIKESKLDFKFIDYNKVLATFPSIVDFNITVFTNYWHSLYKYKVPLITLDRNILLRILRI